MTSISSLPPTDDNTGLLQLLTDEWTEPNRTLVQNSQWTSEYLARLTSLSLDELIHEPTTLRTNRHQIKLDAQQLAYTDYPSFLHAESCRRELGSTLESLDDHFSELLTAAPALQQACELFTDQVKDIAQERAKMTRVLEHQHVLMDLLELPQLMDTCVWNGYYSEAMDLAAHVRLLQVRYPLPVIRTIYDRIQASSDLMLIQLISHLRQPIKLAVAMNIIGHLRRMEAFDSERELRMVFLRCRHSCMEQRLEKIKKPADDATASNVSSSLVSPTSLTTASLTSIPTNSQDTFDYLKRYVDVMREQMFEMATHYMSIFSSNETDTLLSDYMTHMVMQIQLILSEHLRYIDDTSALASLLTQLQYCGMSLGRVGLDFRHLFVGSFEQAVKPLVLRIMDQSTNLLAIDVLQAATKDQVLPSTWLNTNQLGGGDRSSSSPKIASPSRNTTSSNNSLREQHPYQPPIILVDYPCLAVFTNGILTALNALRLLPAIGLYSLMNQHLNTCLLDVASAIKTYGDEVARQFPDESTFMDHFVTAYARYCVPFLQRCLVEGIFGYSVGQGDDDDSNSNITKDIEAQLADYLVTSVPAKILAVVQDNEAGDDNTDDIKDNKLVETMENNHATEEIDAHDLKPDISLNDTSVDDSFDDFGRNTDESNSDDSTNNKTVDKGTTIDNKASDSDISNNSPKEEPAGEQITTNELISNDGINDNTPGNEDGADRINEKQAAKDDTDNIAQSNDASKPSNRS